MTFLLHHRRSRPTGTAIAQALGVSHGEEVPTDPTRRYGAYNAYQENVNALIRWGSRMPHAGHAGRVLNRADAIGRASDKLSSLGLLREAGVLVPDWSEDPTDLEFPFLGRRRSHARGTDIVLCLQRGDYTRSPRDYYVQYVPTLREFRIHVAGGEVIRVQGKYLDNPQDAKPWIRNYASGYRFRSPRRRLRPDRLEQAIKAVEALGLDFGAVDLLIADDERAYVLEVNTAPSCSPLTAAAYVTAFQKMLGLPDDQVVLSRLDILRPDQDDDDTDDEVEV